MGAKGSLPVEANKDLEKPPPTTADRDPPSAIKRKQKEKLSGVRLVEYKCRKKKKKWNECVSSFYNDKFLTGKAMEPDSDCDDAFEEYRRCFMKGMLKEREKSGLPPPQEGSMLHEFIEENEE